MPDLSSIAALRAACRVLPPGDAAAAAAVAARQARLTKPPGSLGRLEGLVSWLAQWQGRAMPRMDRVQVLVFAGNHGVAARGVSPYPAAVTAQMVANFAAGGAAINQLCAQAGAALQVVPLQLEHPTADFTTGPALDEAGFLQAVRQGAAAVPEDLDLLCLGEMGIGNTTAGAALAAALFGGGDAAASSSGGGAAVSSSGGAAAVSSSGGGAAWAGRGTGVDDAGLARKVAVIEAGLAFHAAALADPLEVARRLGGRELAALLGAALAARYRGVPVLLDGFTTCAAVAPLARLAPGGLDHAEAAHCSAEAGHRRLLAALGKVPLLDLGLRLGEASGAALAVPLLRGALACHAGMATFAEAGVAEAP